MVYNPVKKTQTASPGRQSNIELLKILAVMGVITLHCISPADGAMSVVGSGSIKYFILLSLESLAICAVNIFMMISGYFLSCSRKKRTLQKTVMMLVQTSFFCFVRYLISVATGSAEFSVKLLMLSFLPTNYFVILYLTTYWISPYVNIIIDHLSRKQLRTFAILLLVLFSVLPTITDVFEVLTQKSWNDLSTIGIQGSQQGYTIVNFLMMYIIGGTLRREKDYLGKAHISVIGMGIATCVILIASFARFSIWKAMAYSNIAVIVLAVLIFDVFFRIHLSMRAGKVINRLAEAVFTANVFHRSVLPFVFSMDCVNWSVIQMVCHCMLSAFVIYMLCAVAHYVYQRVTEPIFGKFFEVIRLPCIDLEDTTEWKDI